jgi:N6-adenosine-specific RNA methylase IME4
MPDTFPVIKWTEIDSALARAQSIIDLNSLRLKVETLQHLSKQSKQSLHTQNLITGYRLRIDRKRGEWLREHIDHGGDRRSGSRFPTGNLKTYGITGKESHILQRIASIPVEAFEKHVQARLDDAEELTTADMLRLEVGLRYKNRKAPPLPKGTFDVIYVDPPYQYEFAHTHIKPVAEVYPTLSLQEICALEVGKLAAKNCTLFLWVPSSHLDKFPAILTSWGFRFCTSWIWNKVKGNFSFYGSISHEIIIIGARGSGVPTCSSKKAQSILSVQSIPKTAHSAKPKEYYKLIEFLYPGRRYLELFARGEPRKGWTRWGDEAIE